MPRLPEHPVVRRLPNQSNLTVERQASEWARDSAIVIQMLAAAVCGTDLGILCGARADRAEVLGHEGVGLVLAAPEGSGVLAGDRVIINPVHRQHPEIVIGHSRDGIFRGLYQIDAEEAREGGALVSCPRDCSLSDTELVLAEPLGSVLYSLELLREQCGRSSLLIRGSGTVAIMAAKLWAAMDGAAAMVISQSEGHADWLRKATRWSANIHIRRGTQLADAPGHWVGLACRAAILCCSREDAPEGLRTLLDALPDGATIDLMAGFRADYREPRLGNLALDGIRWNNIRGERRAPLTRTVDRSSGKTIQLLGHRGTSEAHILQAIDLLSRGVISQADIPHMLCTLEQLPDTVRRMLSSEERLKTKWVKAIAVFPREHHGEAHGAC